MAADRTDAIYAGGDRRAQVESNKRPPKHRERVQSPDTDPQVLQLTWKHQGTSLGRKRELIVYTARMLRQNVTHSSAWTSQAPPHRDYRLLFFMLLRTFFFSAPLPSACSPSSAFRFAPAAVVLTDTSVDLFAPPSVAIFATCASAALQSAAASVIAYLHVATPRGQPSEHIHIHQHQNTRAPSASKPRPATSQARRARPRCGAPAHEASEARQALAPPRAKSGERGTRASRAESAPVPARLAHARVRKADAPGGFPSQRPRAGAPEGVVESGYSLAEIERVDHRALLLAQRARSLVARLLELIL